MNSKIEKDKSKYKKIIIAIIAVFLILSGSMSVVKGDIHRIKNKIIDLHEYSGM
ncbi:hypothetical protein PN398_14025 [Romboutsia sp. 1001216sp1]|uniref:hypothetical protein n=1 Tax=Romboutsia sp. 1001216sp1 TaxID=2986997 RepID=UPI00232E28CF|nr:hypothetical protein [Romboutsia sp. 1001216sp1]MDB8791839.1 hypothetical protein [Romboutsia sp. 1001216sp1]